MRKPKHVHEFKDRHGKARCYFRKPGGKAIPLPGLVWSPPFMEAYQAALDGVQPRAIASPPALGGSIAELVEAFCGREKFAALKPSTKLAYRAILAKIVAAHGERAVSSWTRESIEAGLYARAATPQAANRWLKMMSMLGDHAVATSKRLNNPALGIKPISTDSDGIAAWSAEQVAQYRAFHATGTKQRLAFELLVTTMQRRSDVVRFGRQHISGGTIAFKQFKTGTHVALPVLPELTTELAHLPAGQMTFLMTQYGKPFTAAGFGGWFRGCCNDAGIPVGYSAHGLRKFGAVRLAEAGCSTQQIMAWGGWKTLSEVERYTASANRKLLAQSALVQMESK